MDDVNESIYSICDQSQIVFCRFITANDIGKTGAHQSGFYLPKNSWPLFFNRPGIKGENKDLFVKIKWQDSFETDSRFIYYGKGTRDEYRLTRFGLNFPFLNEENTGDLLVVAKRDIDYYNAWVLSTDEQIQSFLNYYSISPTESNCLIKGYLSINQSEIYNEVVKNTSEFFPVTRDMALQAREIHEKQRIYQKRVLSYDEMLIEWVNIEYALFKAFENDRYKSIISGKISSLDELISISNTILNRRKSRAGKSLEHHLSAIFDLCHLTYTAQGVTENNSKPDFIFPDIFQYHLLPYADDKLAFLGAKTTCKDRWRQILNEADKIPEKHLFTLQQGISKNQLKEMYDSRIILVVPRSYKNFYPAEYRSSLLSLCDFIAIISQKQKMG